VGVRETSASQLRARDSFRRAETDGQDVLTGGLKMCTRCRQKMPFETFTLKPQLSSGRDSWCRPGRTAYLRA